MNARTRMKAATCLFAMIAATAPAIAAEEGEAAKEPAPAVLPRPATDSGVFVLDSCPISKQGGGQEGFLALLGGLLLPLAKAVVQPIVEAGVDFVARKLDQRALDLNASATARSNGQFFVEKTVENQTRISTGFGCVAIIRAKFGAGGVAVDESAMLKGAGAGGQWSVSDIKAINNALAGLAAKGEPFAKNVSILSTPEFYAEFPLDIVMATAAVVEGEPEEEDEEGKSKKRGAGKQPALTTNTFRTPVEMSLRPELIDYRLRGAKRGSAGKQIVVDLSIVGEIATEEGVSSATIFAHTYDIGQMNPGERKRMPQYDAPFAAAPTPSIVMKPYVAAGASGRLEGQTIAYTHLVPFVVTATVKEIEKGGDFEKAIAESLRQNKEQIATPVVALTEAQLKKAFGIKDDKKEGDAK